VVATKEMQIDHCVKIIETAAIPTKPNEVLSALNPLTRIPTLQLNTGEVLFDSSLICEYLDEFSDGGLAAKHGKHKAPRVISSESSGMRSSCCPTAETRHAGSVRPRRSRSLTNCGGGVALRCFSQAGVFLKIPALFFTQR
jgi:glutathione S-transferase